MMRAPELADGGTTGVESIGTVLGWLSAITALTAMLTLGCLLAALVEVASAGGGFAGRSLPRDVARRSLRVEARIRARYRAPANGPDPYLATPAGVAPVAPPTDLTEQAVARLAA